MTPIHVLINSTIRLKPLYCTKALSTRLYIEIAVLNSFYHVNRLKYCVNIVNKFLFASKSIDSVKTVELNHFG